MVYECNVCVPHKWFTNASPLQDNEETMENFQTGEDDSEVSPFIIWTVGKQKMKLGTQKQEWWPRSIIKQVKWQLGTQHALATIKSHNHTFRHASHQCH